MMGYEATVNGKGGFERYRDDVRANFDARCAANSQDSGRMWDRIRYPDETVLDLWRGEAGVGDAGEKLHYRAVVRNCL